MRWPPTIVCGAAVLLAPLWLWRPAFQCYYLRLDDFVYLSRGRLAANLERGAMTPHNGHLTPLFLLETHLVARAAGSLEALPAFLGWAAFAGLAATMAGVGHVVARQTGRVDWGLAAMAGFGLSTVPGPALLWYSASQALLTGAVVTAMLAALELWSARGWLVALALAVTLAAAAPFCWSAGYTAGLVGAAYLCADARRGARSAAVALALASVLAAALAWTLAGDAIRESTRLARLSLTDVRVVSRILDHSNQAVWEKLVFNNLGLDVRTTPGQATVLSGVVLAAWLVRRFRAQTGAVRSLWNPLTAAGAAIVVINYMLIFSTRGRSLGYEHLRNLGWYDAVPQIGAVLWVAGVWAGPRVPCWHRPLEPPSPRGLSCAVAFAALLFIMQAPRARRILFEYDGMAARVARLGAPRNALAIDWPARAREQRSVLARFDRIERDQERDPVSRAELARHVSQLNVPGAPPDMPGYRLVDLVDPEPASRQRVDH